MLCSVYNAEKPYLCKIADEMIENILDVLNDKSVSELFCSQILLRGDNIFFYVNNKLLELQSNYCRRVLVYNYIGCFNKIFLMI